jgi:hypothetical protein
MKIVHNIVNVPEPTLVPKTNVWDMICVPYPIFPRFFKSRMKLAAPGHLRPWLKCHPYIERHKEGNLDLQSRPNPTQVLVFSH